MKWVSTTSLSLVLILALSAGVQAAPEGGRSKQRHQARTVELAYREGSVPYVACADCPGTMPRSGERFITVEVIDSMSPTGYADVAWTTADPDDPGYIAVCGKTEGSYRIPARADLTVYPWAVPGPDCPGGFSTSGTVMITFSRVP